jgi:ATP-dependent DNA helicase RecQ
MARSLRPFQSAALATLQAEVHLALTAPTGSGKGVILEELARDRAERILLITPLIALARQQSRRFALRGVPHCTSVALGSGGDPGPGPEDRVWILGPESALAPRRAERIRDWRPTLVAIDEAHCLEEWGEAFRPAYEALIGWIRRSGWRRTLWMSATFPRALERRLREEIPGVWENQGTFALPENLEIAIRRTAFSDRVEAVREKVFSHASPGILFCGTRKSAENYVRLFAHDGIVLLPYHAGLSDEERRATEAVLEKERTNTRCPSISATNAFGMGMDFPQLRWALLAQAPFSLLSLMQAFGRVGRGGNSGEASILWAEEDFRIAGYLVGGGTNRAAAETRLAALRKFLEGDDAERNRSLRESFL